MSSAMFSPDHQTPRGLPNRSYGKSANFQRSCCLRRIARGRLVLACQMPIISTGLRRARPMQAILHRQMVRGLLRCLQRGADRGGGLHRRVGAHVSTKRVTYAPFRSASRRTRPKRQSAGRRGGGGTGCMRPGLLQEGKRTTAAHPIPHLIASA